MRKTQFTRTVQGTGAPLTRVPHEASSISMASSFKWDHPNGRGVLLPGQTHCHTGKLVPFDDYDLDAVCELVCSPCGRFPDPDAPVRVKGTAHLAGAMVGKSADKENRDARTNVPPMETAGWALMGCMPCGSTKRWSCCGTCAGGCRMWSEEGYVMTGGAKPGGEDASDDASDDDAPNSGAPLEGTPDAAEFASWDGCVGIPTPAVVPLPEPRLEGAHGERIARLTVGRGAVTCIAVSGCGTRMACGGSDGSASVYALDLVADDLAPELIAVAYPGAPLVKSPTRAQKNKTAIVCLDSDSDEEDVEAGMDADELAEKRAHDAEEAQRIEREQTEGGHLASVSSVAFHPDALSFYTGSLDGTCKRWKIPTVNGGGSSPVTLMSTYANKKAEERGAVRSILVSADGSKIYVGGEEACLAVYDAGSGDVIARTYSPRWPTKDKDGLGVPAVDDEDEDPEAVERAAKAAELKAEREAAMTPEELAAVRAEEAAEVEAKARYIEEKRYRNRPKGFGGVNTIVCIAGGAGESGDLVFTGSRDCSVRRWSVRSGGSPVVERVIPGHKAPVTAIAVSRDGSELVTCGGAGDGELRHYRWQPVRGVDAEYVGGVQKSVAGSYVRVRTIRRGPDGFKTTAHPTGVLAAVISPDERYLYTVGDEGGVEVAISRWSVETGAEDKDFRIETNHQGGVTSMCLFPDVAPLGSDAGAGAAAVTRATAARAGGRIITGGADGCVDLWTCERHDDGAGQQLAAESAQQEAAMVATEYQRAQVKLTALSPELSRPAMAARGRKELPALEAAKFPVDEETGEKKDLEDFTVEEFEPFTSKELITLCCAHGLLFIDPKKPPESKRAIAERMVAFFRDEKEKARIRAREERMGLAQPAKSRERPRIPGIESPEEKKKPQSGDDESEVSETEVSETELSETEAEDEKKDEE